MAALENWDLRISEECRSGGVFDFDQNRLLGPPGRPERCRKGRVELCLTAGSCLSRPSREHHQYL